MAVAYLRASTNDQRLGTNAQRTTIEAWAKSEAITISAWFVDEGASGGSDLDDRPVLAAALEQIRAVGAGVLVVAKRDRLARGTAVSALIERAISSLGARVMSADGLANGTDPADDLLRAILEAFAQYERALIRGRTKAALGAKRARGERVGTIPFGRCLADDGIRLISEPREQKALNLVRALRARGLSFRVIARELQQRGFVSRNGRSISVSRVHKMASTT